MVMLPAGAVATWLIVKVLALVEFLKTSVPPVVEATPNDSCAAPLAPTDRLPPTVMVEPLSLIIESPMLPPAVNLASLPAVPEPVMPPPTPAQLPAVLQTV